MEDNVKNTYKKRFKPVPLLSGIDEIIEDFEERLVSGDVTYGIEILDDYVDSIRKGSVTFILARPNTGKSLLGQNMAVHLARQGKRVLICSCEMGSGHLMERQIKQLANQNMSELMKMYKNQRETANNILYSFYDEKYKYLEKIDIMETGGATVEDLIEVFNIFPEYDYIVIDYIQRIKGQGTEYEVITYSMRELQTYARSTGTPLILCSQAKRPSAGKVDLDNAGAQGKGSGSIEEDGDVGIMLSESIEGGNKYILITLFKNKFGSGKNITYKYRLSDQLYLVLCQKEI